MTLHINFELTETDLAYFRSRFSEAKENWSNAEPHTLIDNAQALVDRGLAGDSPAFVQRRLHLLGRVISMVRDETWQLPSDLREHVLAMLAYFVEPDDLVSDDIPGLGLIDDAIAVELVVRELQHELEAYEEFAAFRSAEEQRRASHGDGTDVTTDDWLADKRSALHSRMRERRAQAPQGWRYTTF